MGLAGRHDRHGLAALGGDACRRGTRWHAVKPTVGVAIFLKPDADIDARARWMVRPWLFGPGLGPAQAGDYGAEVPPEYLLAAGLVAAVVIAPCLPLGVQVVDGDLVHACLAAIAD